MKQLTEMQTAEDSSFKLHKIPDESMPEGFRYEINLDGQPMVPPDNMKSLMDSIIQDIGQRRTKYSGNVYGRYDRLNQRLDQ